MIKSHSFLLTMAKVLCKTNNSLLTQYPNFYFIIYFLGFYNFTHFYYNILFSKNQFLKLIYPKERKLIPKEALKELAEATHI